MNIETRIGKIEQVCFGHGGYQDACIGIHFTLSGKGWGVGTSKSAWDAKIIEHSKHSQWSEADRSREYDEIVRYVSSLLNDAKVSSVDKLKGIPVEVTFDGNMLQSFRILTEAL